MKTWRIILIIVLFMAFLSALRIGWFQLNDPPERRYAVQGVLDLRESPMPPDRLITLGGQWEFYPGRLLAPGEAPPSADSIYYSVPARWPSSWMDDAYAYGTYRLRILLNPDDAQRSFGMMMQYISSSHQLFINGQRLGGSGTPAADRASFVPHNIPYPVSFFPDGDEIELRIHVAHADSGRSGGIERAIKFGYGDAFNRYRTIEFASQVVLFAILLLHALYAAALYFIGTRQRSLLYLMALTICATLMLMLDGDRILLTFFPISFEFSIRLSFAVYAGVYAFLYLFAKDMLPEVRMPRLVRLFPALFVGYAVAGVFFVPYDKFFQFAGLARFLSLGSLLITIVQSVRLTVRRQEGVIYLLLAASTVVSIVVWGIVTNSTHLQYNPYPFDLMFAFVMLSAFVFNRHFRTASRAIELSEELRKEVKSKDDFLANTSHELRNPLHGMINIARTVLERAAPRLDAATAASLGTLIDVGQRMSLMLNDLLDATQLKERRIQLHLGRVRLQSVATGVADMLGFMTDGKPVRLVVRIDAEFPAVVADENRLVQILFNLMHNAVKYTEQGTITVTAEAAEGEAHVHVADTGIGIDEETQRRMFDPYVQGDSGMTAVGGGIGLGLSICKQLVELHGGRLWVRSSPGEGSTFTLALPLAGHSAAPDPARRALSPTAVPAADRPSRPLNAAVSEVAASAADGRVSAASPSALSTEDAGRAPHEDKPKILAVDDDPVNLQVLAGMLGEQYTLETATSGPEALIKLHRERWDLVVSDVMMPRMSGFQLTTAVRERFALSELPILLLTARVGAEHARAGFLAGANDYVSKPVDALELKARVRALTDLRQSVAEQLRTEAAWLQAQIEPHFFLNTLNSIMILLEHDQERMKTLLDAFTDYLQASYDFCNSDQFVPLRRELDLVRSYLLIMEERFAAAFRVEWELDSEVPEDMPLPPLSIQPLVENALQHGILPLTSPGVLRIQVTGRSGSVEIAVADDGVGMDERTRSLLLKNKPQQGRGVGLFNTDRRLKQAYGSGLHIRSEPDRGTTVSFRIPER